jgi:CRISPR-associated protein Csh1
MIEGISQLGQLLLGSDDSSYIDLLIQPITLDKKEQYLVGINFDTQFGSIEFEVLKNIPQKIDDSEKKDIKRADNEASNMSLWVGNAASNNPQLRLTTNQISYLVSQSIPLLRNELSDDSELRNQLDEIVKTFFYDLGEIAGDQRKFRYVIDVARLGIALEINFNELKAIKSPKEITETVSSAVQKYIDKTISSKQVALYTVMLNGQILAQSNDYKEFLKENLQPDFDSKSKGNCFICNEENSVSANVTKLKFKYYIEDKISFSSNFQGNFDKNFSFCQSCYTKLQAGENFIQNNLRTNIGSFSVYLVPKFIFDLKMFPKQLSKFAGYVLFSFNTAKNFEGINTFYNTLRDDYIEYDDMNNSFIFNILFFKKNKAEMKILKLIKDVPPARLARLIKTTNDVREVGNHLMKESDYMWNIDLGKIYYLTPVKKSGGDPTAYKELLELYSAIISGGSVDYLAMIRQFTDLIRVYRFEKFPVYNITKPNDVIWGMTSAVTQCNLLLLYLRLLGLLKGGCYMEQTDLETLKIDEDMKEFVGKMGYNESQIALFLMGKLIGEIGWRQGGKEPILEKITYQGMDSKRLLRLTNDIFEKLKQYKALTPYNKNVFTACKMLLDKYITNWTLDDQENVFYILSGYSYRRQHSKADTAEPETNEPEETDESNLFNNERR